MLKLPEISGSFFIEYPVLLWYTIDVNLYGY